MTLHPIDIGDPQADPQSQIEYAAHCLRMDIKRLSEAANDPSRIRHLRGVSDELGEASESLAALLQSLNVKESVDA